LFLSLLSNSLSFPSLLPFPLFPFFSVLSLHLLHFFAFPSFDLSCSLSFLALFLALFPWVASMSQQKGRRRTNSNLLGWMGNKKKGSFDKIPLDNPLQEEDSHQVYKNELFEGEGNEGNIS